MSTGVTSTALIKAVELQNAGLYLAADAQPLKYKTSRSVTLKSTYSKPADVEVDPFDVSISFPLTDVKA